MAKKSFKLFEKSKADKDKGFKEGSKADKKADKFQFAKFKKGR